MSPILERSAGVIPFRVARDGGPAYLLIHSALVRCPRARWEFPKGGIEPGETPREAAAREFREETGLVAWRFRDGFERSLSYTYVRGGRRRDKTVTYLVAEVLDDSTLARSWEHVEDPAGRWYVWGPRRLISAHLYYAPTRELFAAADEWLRGTISAVDESPGRAAPRAGTMALAEER